MTRVVQLVQELETISEGYSQPSINLMVERYNNIEENV